MDFATLSERLLGVLSDEGPRVAEGLPVAWHVESVPHHRHYSIVDLLVFVDPSSPEDELAAVSIHLEGTADARWLVDATGPGSLFLAELPQPSEEDGRRMITDPDYAAEVIQAFLDLTRPSLRRVLSSSAHEGLHTSTED